MEKPDELPKNTLGLLRELAKLCEDYSYASIGRAVGVSAKTVCTWLQAAERETIQCAVEYARQAQDCYFPNRENLKSIYRFLLRWRKCAWMDVPHRAAVFKLTKARKREFNWAELSPTRTEPRKWPVLAGSRKSPSIFDFIFGSSIFFREKEPKVSVPSFGKIRRSP